MPPRRRSRGVAWTPDQFWRALLATDKSQVASALGCGLSNVHNQVRRFRSTSPGGRGTRLTVDRDNHRLMARMVEEARFEVLAAVAFISPSPPPVLDHLLEAAIRGVAVKLLFRSDNLTGALVESLQWAGVPFRTLPDLHAKFLITDTTALSGSANLTEASATRAREVGVFLDDAALVHEVRGVFHAYWQEARPY